jgi:hypothetical protein
VDQGVSPEFKSQCCRKKFNKCGKTGISKI